MKSNAKIGFALLGVACLIYAGLRFWNLTASCLWFDEIFSVHAAEHSWADLFWFVAQDLIHPPLFYVFLKIWILIGGESVFWLRLFPVIFSLFAIVPFILLARELKLSFLTTALALVLFAVNGSLIKYAQEVRMYAPLMFFALASMWLFARFFNDKKSLIALLFVNVLLVYTHYFGWFVILSEILAVAVLKRENLSRILMMTGAVFLSFAPWIYAVAQAAKMNSGGIGQNIGWMTRPNLRTIFQFVYDLFEPVYFQQSSADSNAILFVTLPIIAVGLAAFVFLIAHLPKTETAEKRNLLMLGIFAATPFFAAFVISWISPYSIFGTRHLIVVFAPFAILLAAAIAKINVRIIQRGALALTFVLFGAAFILQARQPAPQFIWCAWENLAAEIPPENNASAAARQLYVFEDLVAYHFWFALRSRLASENIQIVKVNGVEGLIEDKAYFLPRGFDEVKVAAGNEISDDDFWLAFRDKNWNEAKPPLANLLGKNYQIAEKKSLSAQNLNGFLVRFKKAN